MTAVDRAKSDLLRMDAELARLQSQMAALGIRREKVRAYIEMAEFYESDEAVTDVTRIKGGVSGAAVRAAIEAIRERKQAIHTRELLEILAKQSIQVGGSNPVANLSGFLSRSTELRNSRVHGWGLAEWGGDADAELQGDVEQSMAGKIIGRLNSLQDPDAITKEDGPEEDIPF